MKRVETKRNIKHQWAVILESLKYVSIVIMHLSQKQLQPDIVVITDLKKPTKQEREKKKSKMQL